MMVPARLLNTALMVAPQWADEIIRAAQGEMTVLRQAAKSRAAYGDADLVRIGEAGYAVMGDIAVIPIEGGLIYRGYGWTWETSYLDIRKAFRAAMANPQVKTILFDIDSPGGEVAGVFDLSDEIYSARGKKPLIAMVNEDAFSGAYAIASAADQVFLPRTGRAGSIGVIAIHVDQSGYDAKMGVKYTPIFAGARKNDFNPHEPLDDTARRIMQEHIDKVYGLFVATVARNRGMTEEAVMATEAGIFVGDEAVRIGLADGVRTIDQVLDVKRTGGRIMAGIEQIKELIKAENPEAVDGIMAELGYIKANEIPDVESVRSEAMENGRKQEREQIIEVLEACMLGGYFKGAVDLVRNGATAQEAKQAILEWKAKEGGGDDIRSTVGADGTSEARALSEFVMRSMQKR
ncbi:MAG: S49 family peptidase [Chloroflexota bacterium]